MTSSQESFAQTELVQALTEESYGLKNFEIIRKTQLDSAAKVTTLEGDTVTISLTSRGYQIQKAASTEEGQIYESIEEVLQVVSPLYLQAKQRLLVERLSSIAFKPTELRTQ